MRAILNDLMLYNLLIKCLYGDSATKEDKDLVRDQLKLIQEENSELRIENNNLKEQLKMYIPRRRVRRVYNYLGNVLKADLDPLELERILKEEEKKDGMETV